MYTPILHKVLRFFAKTRIIEKPVIFNPVQDLELEPVGNMGLSSYSWVLKLGSQEGEALSPPPVFLYFYQYFDSHLSVSFCGHKTLRNPTVPLNK